MHQKVQKRVKRSYFPPTDPQWGKQWSLVTVEQSAYINTVYINIHVYYVQLNSGQVGGSHDLNVEPAWIQGLTGKGVTVAVVDDGKHLNTYTC